MSDTDAVTSPERALRLRIFVLAGIVVCVDLLSKNLAQEWLTFRVPMQVLSVLDLRLQFNAGAAFSLFHDSGATGRIILSCLSLLLIAVIVRMMLSLQPGQWLYGAGLALVCGGGFGNLYERVMFGYVTDFISVHWQRWYFPTFNVADSAISCGAVLVLWAIWRQGRAEPVP